MITLLWIIGIYLGLSICTAILSIFVGAFFKVCFWALIKLPLALIVWALAICCCCTLILIPIGLKLFSAGLKLLVP